MNEYKVYNYGKAIISQIWDNQGNTLNLEGESENWSFLPVKEYFAS